MASIATVKQHIHGILRLENSAAYYITVLIEVFALRTATYQLNANLSKAGADTLASTSLLIKVHLGFKQCKPVGTEPPSKMALWGISSGHGLGEESLDTLGICWPLVTRNAAFAG